MNPTWGPPWWWTHPPGGHTPGTYGLPGAPAPGPAPAAPKEWKQEEMADLLKRVAEQTAKKNAESPEAQAPAATLLKAATAAERALLAANPKENVIRMDIARKRMKENAGFWKKFKWGLASAGVTAAVLATAAVLFPGALAVPASYVS